jgi:hypothetical protein
VLIVIAGIGFQQVIDFIVGPAAQALLRGLEYSHLVFGSMTMHF